MKHFMVFKRFYFQFYLHTSEPDLKSDILVFGLFLLKCKHAINKVWGVQLQFLLFYQQALMNNQYFVVLKSNVTVMY